MISSPPGFPDSLWAPRHNLLSPSPEWKMRGASLSLYKHNMQTNPYWENYLTAFTLLDKPLSGLNRETTLECPNVEKQKRVGLKHDVIALTQ